MALPLPKLDDQFEYGFGSFGPGRVSELGRTFICFSSILAGYASFRAQSRGRMYEKKFKKPKNNNHTEQERKTFRLRQSRVFSYFPNGCGF